MTLILIASEVTGLIVSVAWLAKLATGRRRRILRQRRNDERLW